MMESASPAKQLAARDKKLAAATTGKASASKTPAGKEVSKAPEEEEKKEVVSGTQKTTTAENSEAPTDPILALFEEINLFDSLVALKSRIKDRAIREEIQI